jgi:hypothetical protein
VFDAAPFQFVAHGFVPVAAAPGPVAAFANGVASVTNVSPGLTHIDLDEGLPGGGTVDLEDVRLMLTVAPIPGVPATIDGVAIILPPAGPGAGPGPTRIIVQTWNALTGARTSAAFWFTVGRPAESLS